MYNQGFHCRTDLHLAWSKDGKWLLISVHPAGSLPSHGWGLTTPSNSYISTTLLLTTGHNSSLELHMNFWRAGNTGWSFQYRGMQVINGLSSTISWTARQQTTEKIVKNITNGATKLKQCIKLQVTWTAEDHLTRQKIDSSSTKHCKWLNYRASWRVGMID